MKLLFCGLGQIAKRHITIIQRHFPHYEIFALRLQNKTSGSIAGVKELYNWAEVNSHAFAAAFITSPTYLHIPQALECACRGIPIFIEKPLGNSLEKLDDLLVEIRIRRISSYVAYNFRFHPLVLKLKEKLAGKKILHARIVFGGYMPNWRTKKDYRQSATVFRTQGGGVILDCSHEIDMAAFLFGSLRRIDGRAGRVSGLTEDAEDFADILLTHERTPATLHLNFFSRVTERTLTVETEENTYHLDLKQGVLRTGNDGALEDEEFTGDRDVMYAAQLKYFFENIGNPRMMNDLFEAAPLFEKMLAFRNAAWQPKRSLDKK